MAGVLADVEVSRLHMDARRRRVEPMTRFRLADIDVTEIGNGFGLRRTKVERLRRAGLKARHRPAHLDGHNPRRPHEQPQAMRTARRRRPPFAVGRDSVPVGVAELVVIMSVATLRFRANVSRARVHPGRPSTRRPIGAQLSLGSITIRKTATPPGVTVRLAGLTRSMPGRAQPARTAPMPIRGQGRRGETCQRHDGQHAPCRLHRRGKRNAHRHGPIPPSRGSTAPPAELP